MSRARLAPPALLALLALLARPAGAPAHEEGVIHLSAERVPVGSEIGIEGKKLGKEVRIRLRLTGALETWDLDEVETGEDGTISLTVALPDSAKPGRYRVVAIAPDDDVVAHAELEVVPAPEAPERSPADSAAAAPEATDEPLPVGTRPDGVEWIVVLAFVLACGAGGLLLLRSA